jgi:hypothetical protein
MRMKLALLVGSACLVFVSSIPVHADIGIGGRVGTLGIGVEVTKLLAPGFNARVGFNLFSYGYSAVEDEVNYDMNLNLRSFAILFDLHPAPNRGFRLTGGILLNGNGVDMTALSMTSYTIGNTTYSADQLGTLEGKVDLGNVTPYLGIGYGNAVSRRIAFHFDLGVVFQGAPDVTLSATGLIALDPRFVSDLNEEEASIEDSIRWFKYYPVVSLGISFMSSVF